MECRRSGSRAYTLVRCTSTNGSSTRRQRVADCQTAVRVCAGVDHHAVDLSTQAVNCIDQLPLAVVLRELHVRAELLRHGSQRSLNVGKRLAAV